MPRPRTVALVLGTTTLVLLSGCGGRAQVVGATRLLHVAVTEYRLRPQSSRVTAGTVTVIAHNYGRLTHNVVILLDGRAQASTPPIPPGTSAELSVFLPHGTYTIASTIQSDQALGVYGTLTVT